MKKPEKKSKAEKISKKEKENKSSKTKVVYNEPGEEEIREKALEIYYQRTERGEDGNAISDWLLAEAWLKE